jgi:Tfp pilus assembly protein PilO
MNQTPQASGLSRAILKQLSHPLKLRLVLCVTMILVWQALFFSPLSDSVSATTARIARERNRAATAREIERLRKAMAPQRDLIGTGDDVHELIRHVMGRIRSSPLRLVDLKPEKPKDLGPFEAISLQLNIEGVYSEIDEFLGWAETNKRLLRVDSIRLTPQARAPGRLAGSVTLVALADKIAPAAKTKATPGKTR